MHGHYCCFSSTDALGNVNVCWWVDPNEELYTSSSSGARLSYLGASIVRNSARYSFKVTTRFLLYITKT